VEGALARVGADRVVVTSAAVGDLFRRPDGSYPRRVRQIANGVDPAVFHPGCDGSGVRADLGVDGGAPLIGAVCRLDPWKGVDVFLRAVAACRGRLPAARFAVIGGEIEGHAAHARELARLARALGVDDVVAFTGWRYGPADMPRVHAALDVLVLPSVEPEPFGLAVVEAMATGRPVVATAHGGPREIVVDGETGLLVPPRDPGRMADAIAAVVARPDRGRGMGRAGRVRAERLYTGAACVRALEGLYAELLEREE
jgi:glycosyltransferase involved in cell wall biosynthesis